MNKYSRSSIRTCVFEIDQPSFPIIGNPDSDLRRRIEAERQVSAFDLWQVQQETSIYYNHPFDSETNEWGEYPEAIDIEKIVVKRDGGNIVFEAIAYVSVAEDDSMTQYIPHPQMPIIVVAQAKIPVRKILNTAKNYVDYHLGNEDLIGEFASAGALEKIEQIDKDRQNLHWSIAEIIEETLADQPIRIATNDESRDRFLSTALLMHVIPSRTFEYAAFLKSTVAAKYKEAYWYYKNSLEHTDDNPFKRGPS